jgi:hypothetical protein
MVVKVKHAFVVTSAINSKFGVFDPEQRLKQTVATIDSIRARVPDARVIVMECCGEPILPAQKLLLEQAADHFVDYSTDPTVQALYDNDNWDVVKNGTEIMCFGRVLKDIMLHPVLEGVTRIHKMSGRYVLNDKFDLGLYTQDQIVDKMVIGFKYNSQFPPGVTMVPLQYMARLWSWPVSRMDEVIKVYEDSFIFFAERLSAGGYVDIEHVLYKFLNPNNLVEIENLGVEGFIAPNGQPIQN